MWPPLAEHALVAFVWLTLRPNDDDAHANGTVEVFEPRLRYFKANPTHSSSWQDTSAQAVGQASVVVRRRGPLSQGRKTFLYNHADGIAAIDMFVVLTISFRLLRGLLILGHGRPQILWFSVDAAVERAGPYSSQSYSQRATAPICSRLIYGRHRRPAPG
jgi:hypothetical protein